jgi:uncharacterized protein (DUF2237 family)
MDKQRNVLLEPIEPCSMDPLTGWFRDGCCQTDERDHGSHTVCVQLTAEFLAYSKRAGNDLSTPRPQMGFAGLEEGDQWCLCAARWQEAFEAGAAPRVVLASTNEKALEIVSLEHLTLHAIDPIALA